MSKYSEISIVELKAREERLIAESEAVRLKIIAQLNIIEKNAAEIRSIQLELIERKNATTLPKTK